MTKICPGCGSVIQYSDENAVGYSPKKDAKLCERCFKLKNYNVKEKVNLKYTNDDIIDLISSKDGCIFFVTDFLNISNDVINTFKKINHHNKFLVINKVDYIPKSIIKNTYIEYIKKTYGIKNEIILVSALKKFHIDELINQIKNYRNSYICGYTNSGKSSIINEICNYVGKKSNIISSLMPNTTLDLIKIKLDENTYIYDTPGLINNYDFDIDSFPKKYIKPVTIQTKPNDIIKLGKNIFIKCDDKVNSFTFYVSDLVNIKKVYNEKITFSSTEKIEDDADLVIYGYGFINIKKSCKVEINTEKYEIRKSMF